ncbi:hypothetical protein HMPREF3033_01409 [Veillonellaceae bacterium DNF00751]|nr:hypothetical protein HMPREF3033_01409 [Veillonellaceae bacterium DNF00751]
MYAGPYTGGGKETHMAYADSQKNGENLDGFSQIEYYKRGKFDK